MEVWSPFLFGCDLVTPFAGTLFRLPLRVPDLAARSRISRGQVAVSPRLPIPIFVHFSLSLTILSKNPISLFHIFLC